MSDSINFVILHLLCACFEKRNETLVVCILCIETLTLCMLCQLLQTRESKGGNERIFNSKIKPYKRRKLKGLLLGAMQESKGEGPYTSKKC